MPSVRSQPGAGQRAPRDELSRRLAGCTVTGDKRSARLVSLIGIFLANWHRCPSRFVSSLVGSALMNSVRTC